MHVVRVTITPRSISRTRTIVLTDNQKQFRGNGIMPGITAGRGKRRRESRFNAGNFSPGDAREAHVNDSMDRRGN